VDGIVVVGVLVLVVIIVVVTRRCAHGQRHGQNQGDEEHFGPHGIRFRHIRFLPEYFLLGLT
jgi:hypothetical protein